MTTCSTSENNSCPCKSNQATAVHTPSHEEEEEETDDIWATSDADDNDDNDNDNDDAEGDNRRKELAYNDVVRQHRKQGYVDGITAHREDQLQQGFDDAFPKGARLGVEVGGILAKLRSRLGKEEGKEGKEEETIEFKSAINDLLISKVLDRQYFDENLEPLETHELIEKWKKK
ncbi:YAE1 [Candida margitis]|uniref:YAE1 n=1 Tax=Candida margitis TaxID=1775924 RepID=UPI002227C7EF|nr:YAE1 [Candida margitis]KAI5970790.1 YAE1 [Candida margitis]